MPLSYKGASTSETSCTYDAINLAGDDYFPTTIDTDFPIKNQREICASRFICNISAKIYQNIAKKTCHFGGLKIKNKETSKGKNPQETLVFSLQETHRQKRFPDWKLVACTDVVPIRWLLRSEYEPKMNAASIIPSLSKGYQDIK